MEYSTEALFQEAKQNFIDGNYKMAESMLAQLLLKPQRNPEIHQMLGTIYYDQGKFNKAIKSFQRALELDPTYTDASVGLSIILNDIGRYEEGKKVFNDAKKLLELRSNRPDPYIDEKIANKHEELADLYFQYKKFPEALEQLLKAQKLSARRAEITMRISEVLVQMGNSERAIKDLKNLVIEYPQFIPAKNKLGVILYNEGRMREAADQWESVLMRDPQNPEAVRYLKQIGSLRSSGHLNL
ncbi:MAG: tetratricopeptide repeat protein [Bdellovibrionaceae bacterium]|nr:tetratricopeptide repeat protein [Pseudobdellovibrionaceae bacterium]